MSGGSSTRKWLGIGSLCLLACVAAARCQQRSSHAVSGGSPTAPGERPARGASTSAPSPRIAAGLAQIVAATPTVISAPVASRGPALAPPQPLTPELVTAQRAAVATWQRAAQQALDRCVPPPARDRQATSLIVWLAPLPRAPQNATQVLAASSIAVPAHELERLGRDIDPGVLQSCIDRLRGLSMSIALTGTAVEHEYPTSAENIVVQL